MEDLRKLQNGSDVRGIAMEGVPGEEINLTTERAAVIARAFVLWLEKLIRYTAGMAAGRAPEIPINAPGLEAEKSVYNGRSRFL